MEKTVYITEKEREMCYKVIGAFAELYEMEDEDILVVDVGRYGFVKLQPDEMCTPAVWDGKVLHQYG